MDSGIQGMSAAMITLTMLSGSTLALIHVR